MADNIQGNWRWCFKCQGLWLAGNSGSACPGRGAHSQSGSGNYALVHNLSGPERQSDWRWCSKCQGLWFSGTTGSKCPAGAGHSQTGSGNYSLSHNAPNVPEQSLWRWCNKCQGMFWAGPVTQALSPTACKPIANEIKGLEAERDSPAKAASNGQHPAEACVGGDDQGPQQANHRHEDTVHEVRERARLCAAGGSHSSVGSGEYRIPQTPENVRLHFKILTSPTSFTPNAMLERMRQVYNAVGIGVDLVSTETLDLPTLMDLSIGECNGTLTSEQTQLFNNRNNVVGNDLVIYFVRTTIDPANGCALHPAGSPARWSRRRRASGHSGTRSAACSAWRTSTPRPPDSSIA